VRWKIFATVTHNHTKNVQCVHHNTFHHKIKSCLSLFNGRTIDQVLSDHFSIPATELVLSTVVYCFCRISCKFCHYQ